MSVMRQFTGLATLAIYTFVAFEFLFMIMPFLALAYYPAYGGMLAWLADSPWTAGLTGFFLPHFSKTDDALMDSLGAYGRWTALVGIVLFFISAVPLYFSKLFLRKEVTGGLYAWIRHPQYLAFTVIGVGLLLTWPRFIALYALVTMMFAYVALARHEERDCLDKFGESYAAYMKKTGAFLPKWIPTPNLVPRNASAKRWIITYAIAMMLAGVTGAALREHAIHHISAVYNPREVILSPARLSDAELLAAHKVAISDSRVQEFLSVEDTPRITYVLPQEWYMPDLPIDPLDYVREHGGHGANADFDRSKLQVLFATADTFSPKSEGKSILRRAHSITPLTIVDIDVAASTVEQVLEPPPHTVWGDFPMPLF